MKGLVIITIVSIFLIIIVMASINQSISSKKLEETRPWPPHISKCPDYWTIDPKKADKCVNTSGINLGRHKRNSTIDSFDDKDPNNRVIPKMENYKLYWDGISTP